MMNDFGILAEVSLADVSEYDRVATATESGQAWMLIPVVILAAVFGVYRLCNRLPSAVNTPAGLLTELCRAHGLKAAAGKLLHKVSRAAELPQPATMLMSVEGFEDAVASAGRRIRFNKSDQKVIAAIRRSVFD
jgi:hypothetical protein